MSGPESFRGLLKSAHKCYREACEATSESDEGGFFQLVSWATIDSAIISLSEKHGELKAKIADLKKDSKKRENIKGWMMILLIC